MKTILLVSVLALIPWVAFAGEPPAPVPPAAAVATLIKAAGSGDAVAQAGVAQLIDQLRGQLSDAKQERDSLVRENQRLRDELNRLNQTLDGIRSQLGNGQVRPSAQ